MIDLHSHTTESDGTYTPSQLIDTAVEIGLDALAITDHDTLAGYRIAAPLAKAMGLRLICGIELSAKIFEPSRKTVHLLGYFCSDPPTASFGEWLGAMQAARRDRNIRLAAKLQSMGVDIKIEEVEALGRSLAGRPHFARLMVQKGYVPNSTRLSVYISTSRLPAMSIAKSRHWPRAFDGSRKPAASHHSRIRFAWANAILPKKKS